MSVIKAMSTEEATQIDLDILYRNFVNATGSYDESDAFAKAIAYAKRLEIQRDELREVIKAFKPCAESSLKNYQENHPNGIGCHPSSPKHKTTFFGKLETALIQSEDLITPAPTKDEADDRP